MRIDNNLKRDIENYCVLNDLNVDIFINKILKKAFLVEKYGDKPNIFNTSAKKVISYSFHCKFEKDYHSLNKLSLILLFLFQKVQHSEKH